jgi:hypothetical protein
MNKFIFEGDTLHIHINPLAVVNNTIEFSVEELWTEWIDWSAQGDNSKYPFALRTVGGDPIGGGQYVGTYLFLRNDLGWRGIPPEVDPCTVVINGSFYGEDPTLPVMENRVGQETDLIINRSSLSTNITSASTNSVSETFLKTELQKIANLILATS